jgi:hypothetical protein
MTIICDKYLREETFQYKDGTTNWELVDGEKWYFIEMQKLLDNELLQADKLNSLQLNADEVELPAGKGICYSGIGVQFEFGGKKYDSTDDNLAILQEALKSGHVKWYWNKDRFRKYGGTTTATFKVGIVNLNANLIPDLSLEITKNVQ